MNLKDTGTFLRAQYDKLLAAAVYALLLAGLIFLGLRLGKVRTLQREFNADLDRLSPEHGRAARTDDAPFEDALGRLKQPFQVGDWTNAMFVPETRVYCIDCRRPIPYTAASCPFCKAPQPPPEEMYADKDGDGMLDEWESAHALNPHDPRDAGMDSDGDQFTNLEEFRAKTDPRDAQSSPPITVKLHVVRIETVPFRLLFKSVSKLPDGSFMFALNTRDTGRTYFAKLGDVIEDFKLVRYEPLSTTVQRNAMGGVAQTVDVSILTLQRGKKLISLQRGKEHPWQEYTVHLLFEPENREFQVKSDGTFPLLDKTYKLISVDTAKEAVVIENTLDGSRYEVGKIPPSPVGEDFQ
jgi:hypothetical protein